MKGRNRQKEEKNMQKKMRRKNMRGLWKEREKRRMVRVRGREKFEEEGNMGIRKGKEENRKE